MSPENTEGWVFFLFLGAKLKLLDKLHNTSYIRQQIYLLPYIYEFYVNSRSFVEAVIACNRSHRYKMQKCLIILSCLG